MSSTSKPSASSISGKILASKPSSSSISASSCIRTKGRWKNRVGERDRGMPEICRCGEASLIRTSGTTKNPGRLFHCCPNGFEGDKYHLFKWTDESMVEEIEDLKQIGSELQDHVESLEKALVVCKSDIEEMKVIILGYEKTNGDIKTEISCLKNIIVCGCVLTGLCYYFLN